jgi:hypothetical protein
MVGIGSGFVGAPKRTARSTSRDKSPIPSKIPDSDTMGLGSSDIINVTKKMTSVQFMEEGQAAVKKRKRRDVPNESGTVPPEMMSAGPNLG